MKIALGITVLLFAVTAMAQSNSCFPYCYACTAMVIDSGTKKVVGQVEFKPITGEEELTHKALPIPGTALNLHATVFFTDESLASNAGADSIRLALAVFKGSRSEGRGIADNAVAEVTLHQFDTARVMAPVDAGSKHFVGVLECRGQELDH